MLACWQRASLAPHEPAMLQQMLDYQAGHEEHCAAEGCQTGAGGLGELHIVKVA